MRLVIILLLTIISTPLYGQNDYWNGTADTSSVIYRSGNVGIGMTSNPSGPLEVFGGGSSRFKVAQGDVYIMSATDLVFENGNRSIRTLTGDLKINPVGKLILNSNVGIGTASPNDPLVIEGNQAGSVIQTIRNTHSSGPAILRLYGKNNGVEIQLGAAPGGNDYGIIQTYTNNALVLGTNNAEKMRILPSGYVGIGTDNPAKNLEVLGANPGINITDSGTSSSHLNLKNNNGNWHISGPRSYEANDPLAIFWYNGAYNRYFTILNTG